MGWDGMGWDGMGWDGMGWDGMGWDGMGWDGMGWDGMGWDGVGWDGMGWDGMGWDGVGWDGMGWDGMGCFVFCFVKNALARVVLVPSRRLPIFSPVVRFPYPCITPAPPFFFFFLPKIFTSSCTCTAKENKTTCHWLVLAGTFSGFSHVFLVDVVFAVD